MNMRKKELSTFEKSIRQGILISSLFGFAVLTILSWYKTADTIIERIVILMVGIMFLFPIIPITFSFLIGSIISCAKRPEMHSKAKNNQSGVKPSKSNSNANTESEKHKFKVVTTEGYTEFNNLLKATVQNKLIDRNSILQLKCELRYRIGTHIEVYKDFKFENDIHEIYVLAKSSVLTKEDYLFLTQFISSNLNLPKEA
jgi:hypothetical protein